MKIPKPLPLNPTPPPDFIPHPMKDLFKRPLLQACGLLLFLLPPAGASAQFKFREPPNRQDPAPLEAREGLLLWEAFRESRFAGSFTIKGELVSRPNAAPSFRAPFLLQGQWARACRETVITLGSDPGSVVQKRLEQCGSSFVLIEGCDRTNLEAGDLRQPLFPDVPVTFQDLVMPYLDWPEVAYLGPDRFLGRPVHRFRLASPVVDSFPASVVVTLDEDYAALLEAELFDLSGFSATRVRVGGFKEFEDGWLFSTLTWEDRRARSSIRLEVYSFFNTP